MKVKFYFATCWCSSIYDECPDMQGVNWFNDKLMFICVWFHNWFVQPFFEQPGFPIRVIKIYEEKENGC